MMMEARPKPPPAPREELRKQPEHRLAEQKPAEQAAPRQTPSLTR